MLGIVLYFAFPNIVQMRSDSEDSLARARAEMLNLAVAAYFQAVGDRATARANWAAAGSDEARYANLLRPYIAFPSASLSAFMRARITPSCSTRPIPCSTKRSFMGRTGPSPTETAGTAQCLASDRTLVY